MKPFLPLALGLLIICTAALANASNREDVSLHWPVIAGPHCESYGEAVAKLEKHILELATDECAEHGLHAPNAGDIQYELHAVLSEWMHYRRAIANNVSARCAVASTDS